MNRSFDTDRLHLRPFGEDDAEAWHAIWGDPEVIWWGANETFERSRASLAGLLRAEREQWPDGLGWLAVLERGGSEIVGDVVLQPAPFVDGVEVGWHFRKHVWNRGYATEAARATIERALEADLCPEVYALVALQNGSSLRVAAKLGMRAVRDMPYADLSHRLFVCEARPRSSR